MSTGRTLKGYTLKPGDPLGPYRIVRPLGAGGMGEVYLAEHVQLRKQYAIKVLPAELSTDAQFLDRFRIEARVMADLEHPHIVRVHNFGEEQGRYFLVMDYVEGPDGHPRTLEDELAWGRNLPEESVRAIALQICDALAYAHGFRGQGVIHRDLKPANILLQKTEGHTGIPAAEEAPANLQIRISDFGLAKILGTEYIRTVLERSTTLTGIHAPAPSPDEQMTQRGAPQTSSTYSLLGTYDYMSPEQKTGMGVDARSDIFSVGIILYRMLTGHKPEGSFDPPSKKGVNRGWDRIVEKCLKRDAGGRYASIAAVRADIARMGSPWRASSRWIAAAAGVLLLAAAAAVMMPRLRSRSPEPLPAPSPAVTAMAPPPEPAPGPAAQPPTPPAEPEPVTPPPAPEPAPAPALPEPAPAPAPAPEPVLEHVRFEVSVKPPDADVKVRADWQQKNQEVDVPLREGRAYLNLWPGAYIFAVMRTDYQPATLAVAVSPTNRWLDVALKEAHGTVLIRGDTDVDVSLRGPDGEVRRLGITDSTGRLGPLSLRAGAYDLVLSRTNCITQVRPLRISEDRPAEVTVKLAQLPGRLLVRSPIPAEVWLRNARIGATDAVITNLPAGELAIQIRRPGFRRHSLTAQISPDSLAEIQAPELTAESAAVHIMGEHPPHLKSVQLPAKARIRINQQPWQEVELPLHGPPAGPCIPTPHRTGNGRLRKARAARVPPGRRAGAGRDFPAGPPSRTGPVRQRRGSGRVRPVDGDRTRGAAHDESFQAGRAAGSDGGDD